MPRLLRPTSPLLALLLAVLGLAIGVRAAQAAPIEAAYAAPGPHGVTQTTVNDASGAAIYRLYAPSDLSSTPERHPIVTWGNGSVATPDDYPGLLQHLASWGYVVIASTSSTTGTGAEILAGAQYLAAQDTTPGSPFEHRLDVGQIAAVGHSQGAGGAVNATTHSAGLIDTTVTWALPAQLWVSPGDAFQVSQLTTPSLFLGGQWDVLAAPWYATTGYFDQSGGPAATGTLKGADHNTVQKTGTGVLGYVTAWLQYRLRGDATAAGAFAGPTPEIRSNPAWEHASTRGLP